MTPVRLAHRQRLQLAQNDPFCLHQLVCAEGPWPRASGIGASVRRLRLLCVTGLALAFVLVSTERSSRLPPGQRGHGEVQTYPRRSTLSAA